MAKQFSTIEEAMQYALAIAENGLGSVEPNPCVGAVVVDDELNLISDGYHQKFGDAHAEVNAIGSATAEVRGKTLLVTLEPCSHHGKTPPCCDAIIAAGFSKVVIGTQDPAAYVDGAGIAKLKEAGIDIQVGVCEKQAKRLIAPFTKLMTRGIPYVHAKWAMTLDGKIAAHTGHSQWISNEQSRALVHELRGRMDAIIVGVGTAIADNPSLTARPPGPRTSTRIVIDRNGRLPSDSHLVKTAKDVPVMVAATDQMPIEQRSALQHAGVEVLNCNDANSLLAELGSREMTNVFIEGGSQIMGAFLDQLLIDEYHIFIAPKIIGGKDSLPPISGVGLNSIPQNPNVEVLEQRFLDGDIYIRALAQ